MTMMIDKKLAIEKDKRNVVDPMKIDKNNVEDIFGLSSLQQGMLFHYINETQEHTNVIQFSLTILEDLDINKIREAWQSVVEANEALRTIFKWEKIQKPVQIVLKKTVLDFEYYDYADEDAVNKHSLIEQVKIRAMNEIDIRLKPIVIRLCKIEENKFEMVITNHHILYDGWSNSIITNEFVNTYRQLKRGQIPEAIQKNKYKEFIRWCGELDTKQQDGYWTQYLQDFQSKTLLPKKESKNSASISVDQLKYVFTKDETAMTQSFIRNQKISLATLLYSAWGILLQKYNDANDVVFGTTVSGRNNGLSGIGNLVGLFINTIPLRVQIDDDYTAEKLFQNVSSMLLEREQHESTPLVNIKHCSEINKKDNLFDSIVVVENYPLDVNQINNSDFKVEKFHMDENTGFDLTVMVTLINTIEIEVMYREESFEKTVVDALLHHLINIIKQMIENPLIKIAELDMLSVDERNTLLFDFNDTKSDIAYDISIHELFEKQVQKTPENIAIRYDNQILSYDELNTKANQLARKLRLMGVKEGSVVCIMVDRSIEMIIGLMSILKAGGAYLPLSKDYPDERVAFILEDSGTQILLQDENNIATGKSNVHTINLKEKDIYQGEGSNLEVINTGRSIAYIIYTSGSTGQPKGVMVEHYTVINYIKFRQRKCAISEQDIILQKTAYTFDVSVWELFWWSFYGASVCMLKPDGEKDPEEIADAIKEHQVTMMHFVPSMLNMFLEYIEKDNYAEKVKSLNHVFSSGEALLLNQVKRFNRLLYKPYNIELHNLYGPTEATIDVTYFDCSTDANLSQVSIGKPIDNVNLHVLDRNLNLVPVGVKGELYISGDCLARGYFNKPELTAERFIENPYLPGYKMYKSGDVVKWMKDGNIEYFGRIDNQVKIRGFRIELEEIRVQLLKIAQISEAVVLIKGRDAGDKFICAYYVVNSEITIFEIKDYLKSVLPGYMIPAYFVKIESMPVGPNGKMNTKSLPEPNKVSLVTNEYVGARDEIDEKLIVAFQEVLGVEKVGLKDDFFDLGGDSIKAIQIASWLNKYQLAVPVKEILEHSTIEELRNRIEVKAKNKVEEVVSGEFQLSPIQEWFFEHDFVEMHHWNQYVCLSSKRKLNSEYIKKVFDKIIEHHDTLRIRFQKKNEKYIPAYGDLEDAHYDFKVIDFEGLGECSDAVREAIEGIQKNMDIHKGPMTQVGLFKTDSGDKLFIAVHHLLIDGISWRILIEDFVKGYEQVNNNEMLVLEGKTSSYKNWVEKIFDYSQGNILSNEVEYWKAVESTKTKRLPLNNVAKDNMAYDTTQVDLELSEADTEVLLKQVNKAYQTNLEDVLLTAVGLALEEWIKSEGKVKIYMEGHGREEISKDIDVTRTVGWFTSIYPVVLDIDRDRDLSYQIRNVKEKLRKVPSRGFGYNVLKYISSLKDQGIMPKEYSDSISFNYLGQFANGMECDWIETSDISTGLSVSPKSARVFDIEIYGMIIDAKLSFTFKYNKSAMDQAKMLELVDYFKESLENIKQHCILRESTQITPYDMGCTSLSIDEFDKVMGNADHKIQKIYNLSPMQEGLMYHTLLSDREDIYCEQLSFDLQGDIDIALFEESLNKIIERHEILRTRFVYDGLSKPQQIVLDESKIKIHHEKILDLKAEAQEQYISTYIKHDRERGFNLSEDLLLRMSVIQTAQDSYTIVWCFQHIIMDGWSSGIILDEFFKIYQSLKHQKQLILNSAPAYSHYISWIEEQYKKEASAYWYQYLNQYNYLEPISRFGKLNEKKAYAECDYFANIDGKITGRLMTLARNNKVTLNTVLNTIWGVLLLRYNNADDVTFGTVVSGRFPEIPQVNEMVGLFINTIPVRIECPSEEQFDYLLDKIQKQTIEGDEYSYYPLADIQKHSQLKQKLIDHIVVFENYPINNNVYSKGNAGFEISNMKSLGLTSYDLNVVFVPESDGIQVRYMFNGHVYDQNFVKDLYQHYLSIIEQVLENKEIRINEIKLVLTCDDGEASTMNDKSLAIDSEEAEFDF